MHRLLLTAMLFMAAASADAGVLDRARETGSIRLGFRADAEPFSSLDPTGVPTGYSVRLCEAVVEAMRARLALPGLEIAWKRVDTLDRFDAIARGDVDLLCSADTETLSRRGQVSFSSLTFVTGGTLLYRVDGPQDFAGLKGGRIGVRAGTTSEADLRAAMAEERIADIEIVDVPSHDEGLRRLAAGELGAYVGDAAILLFRWLDFPGRDKLKLSSRTFSMEPYALALPRGDEDFRLAVDRALAGIYRSRAIEEIFKASFRGANPDDLVRAMYRLGMLAE